jgi:hypothetical protein
MLLLKLLKILFDLEDGVKPELVVVLRSIRSDARTDDPATQAQLERTAPRSGKKQLRIVPVVVVVEVVLGPPVLVLVVVVVVVVDGFAVVLEAAAVFVVVVVLGVH